MDGQRTEGNRAHARTRGKEGDTRRIGRDLGRDIRVYRSFRSSATEMGALVAIEQESAALSKWHKTGLLCCECIVCKQLRSPNPIQDSLHIYEVAM